MGAKGLRAVNLLTLTKVPREAAPLEAMRARA